MPTPLEKIIKQKIRDDGPMSLAEYMRLCLGHPDYGYYMTRDPFGAKGDFTTAPEISQMFGEMIGAWIADTWTKLGAPAKFILLECGPGRGTLMSDALRATKNVTSFHEAVQLHLMEMSPVLQKLQAEQLAQYDPTWHSDLSTLPDDCPIIVIGNEFLDALPACQLTYREAGWMERRIDLDRNDTFRFCEIEAKESLKSAIPQFLIPPKLGGHVEVSLEQKNFLNDLVKIVLKQGGVSLFVDYGFTHNVAGDTMQAIKNQAYCNIFDTPGEADITTHVNFSEISQTALEQNMTVHEPVSQGGWLQRLGISIRFEQLMKNGTEMQRRDIDAAMKRLIGKGEKSSDRKQSMGELFKVIAFSSNPDIELAGFS